jgi:hypothetical protein
LIPESRDLRVDESDPGDVDPPRRLRGDEQLWTALEFARNRDPLLIAARKTTHRIA